MFRRRQQRAIAELYRDFSELAEDGYVGAEMVEQLEGELDDRRQRRLMGRLSSRIKAGDSFGEAISAAWEQEREFVRLAVDYSKTQDRLAAVMARLADLKDREQDRADYLREVAWWPMGYLAAAFSVFAVYAIFVLPQFRELFAGFGAELPGLTRAVFRLAQLVDDWITLVVGALLAIGGMYKVLPRFRRWLDGLLSGLPWLNGVVRNLALSQFLPAFALSVSSGAPAREAAEAAATAVGNRHVRRQIQQELLETAQVADTDSVLAGLSLLPNRMKRRLSIKHRRADDLLRLHQISDEFLLRLGGRTASAVTAIDLLVKLFVVVVVALLVIAIYLPIFQIGQVVQ